MKTIVILGPTGIGKSKLAIELAKKISGVIISADSMQIYKNMEIGTAQPKKEELQTIKHYMIGIKDPGYLCNVKWFVEEVQGIMAALKQKNQPIIITGGTGLYLRGITEGLLEDEKDDSAIREKLYFQLEHEGIRPLLEELKKVDPQKYEVLKENDHRRIIRALSYFKANGVPISSRQNNWYRPKGEFLILGLKLERAKLYKRINLRVDEMMDHGFLKEVEKLIEMKISPDVTSWQAIGYKRLRDYIMGESKDPLKTIIEGIKQDTRRFAKRQLTWFRKLDNIHWFDTEDHGKCLEELVAFVQENAFLKKSKVDDQKKDYRKLQDR